MADIIKRRYRLLSDFTKVYDMSTLNSCLLPQFFEYAHTHPYFDHKMTHRFGLWEDDDKLVAVACYEMVLGEALLSTKKGYEFLLPELLTHAETELSKNINGKKSLTVWIIDTEENKIRLLSDSGYVKVHSEPITIFSYDNSFMDTRLPKGFTAISLEDENDLRKIHECLWKGFNHGDNPDDDIDCRLLMQSGPNFRRDLATIIKAPNGEYVCYAGMWIDHKNHYAYLEPLATIPEYRKMGLATYALTQSMKKTKTEGAEYCFGGAVGFYNAIGFKTISNRQLWKKEWLDNISIEA